MMPFDAANFNGRGRPAPDRDPWGTISLFLLEAAFLVVMLVFVAYVVAVATGGSPDCVVHVPSLACR